MKDYKCGKCGGGDFLTKGKDRYCRPCGVEWAREDYKKNKVKYLARAKEYRLKNLEKVRSRDRKYKNDNKDQINERKRAKRLENLEGSRAQGKADYMKHQAARRLYGKNYTISGKRDKTKAHRRSLNYREKNRLRVNELNRIRTDIKWGVIDKPETCPRCDALTPSLNMYIHLTSTLVFLGFICSLCHGEIGRRRRNGEIIDDKIFRGERINNV